MKLYTHTKKWFSARRDNRMKILSIKRPTVTGQIEHFTNNVKCDDEKVIKRADFCSDVPVSTQTRQDDPLQHANIKRVGKDYTQNVPLCFLLFTVHYCGIS